MPGDWHESIPGLFVGEGEDLPPLPWITEYLPSDRAPVIADVERERIDAGRLPVNGRTAE
jgi:hypothetical protein